MTREEEILNQLVGLFGAADQQSKNTEVVFSKRQLDIAENANKRYLGRPEHQYYSAEDLAKAFRDGAEWAEEHPKNKWHSVDDVPIGQHDIICKNNEGKCWHCTWQYIYDNYLNWKEFVKTMNVEKWICMHEL